MFCQISAVLFWAVWLVHGTQAAGKNWAVLVATSNGWGNYRHQSNICRTYHLLRSNGFDPDNIITFMYDDIAKNPLNPFPGQIFNNYDHENFYYNVIIDYKGEDITPEIFSKVMLGDAAMKRKGRKVLSSGPNDNVFVFLSGHGTPGMVVFPKSELPAQKLFKTVKKMKNSKTYSKMVIYLEACFSGSMFNGIDYQKYNVYTTTSANEREPSYVALCGDKDITVCLTTQFSLKWIPYVEKMGTKSITFDNIYQTIKSEIMKSHIMKYGDMSIGSDLVSDFLGYRTRGPSSLVKAAGPPHLVKATQVTEYRLQREIEKAQPGRKQALARQHLSRAIQLRELAKQTMDLIVEEVKSMVFPPKNVTVMQALVCVEQSYMSFKEHCFTIQKVPSVATELVKIHKLCQSGIPTKGIISGIGRTCNSE